jgi:hypothetical protein
VTPFFLYLVVADIADKICDYVSTLRYLAYIMIIKNAKKINPCVDCDSHERSIAFSGVTNKIQPDKHAP